MIEPEKPKLRLVLDWRRAWRWASIQLSAIGATIYLVIGIWPDAGLTVWNVMPGEVRDMLPPTIARLIAAALFGGVLVARLLQMRRKHHDEAR